MGKFLYPIYKLDLPAYQRWWLYNSAVKKNGVLSDILTGTSLTLENSLPKRFKIFDILGNTAQEQLTGKNLIELKDGTYTSGSQNISVQNGIVSYQGSVGSGGLGFYIPLNQPITLNNGETNTFSVNIEGTVPNYRIAIRLLKTNYETDANSFGRTFGGVVNNKASITATQEDDETFTYAFLFIVADTPNLNFKAFYQLEKGSTATDYEPYCGRYSSTKSRL